MTFKWKIGHAPLECEFETGSIGEAIEILTTESSKLAEVFGLGPAAIGVGDVSQPQPQTTATTGEDAPKRRGRKPANQPDPSTAMAPPPAPIPTAPAAPAPQAPSAPATAAATDGLDIPGFLKREPNAAPPPPMPAAPPVVPAAPAVPPAGVLGLKMIDHITKAKQGDGSAWVKWLSDCGVVVPGASFDEAMECLRFASDEKLAATAAQLQISATG